MDDERTQRIRGFALKDKLVVLPQYRTAYFAITADELRKYHSQTGDTEGIVNYGLSMENIVFSVLMTDREGMVRMSFRSVGDFSANEFARRHFEGGGHKNAAGGRSSLPLDGALEKFLHALPNYKDELCGMVKGQ